MATSGTVTWNLNVASIIEIAYGRVYPEGGSISALGAQKARNHLNLVLLDFTNLGYSISKLELKTKNLTQGTTSYVLDSDVLDIFDVVYSKYDSATATYAETALTRIDLAAYNQINDKETQAFLSQYALYRGRDSVTMYVYPTCDNNNDRLQYWALTRTEDVTAANQDVDLPFRFNNALIAGVAYYMSLEAPNMPEEKIARLKSSYESSADLAFGEDRDRSSMYVTPSFRR